MFKDKFPLFGEIEKEMQMFDEKEKKKGITFDSGYNI